MHSLAQSSVSRVSGAASTCKSSCVLRPGASLALRLPPPRRQFVVTAFREERGAASPDTNGVSAKRAEPLDETSAVPSPPPPLQPQPQPQPQPQQPPGFAARRLAVFSGLVLGYAAYYLTRNSLTYTAPVMVADPSLGFSLAQVGTMTSIFPIAYGLSKFVSGILGDRYSPSLLLGGGLMLTAACNLALGAGNGLTWFAAMWALNGLMQGVGAPSCARMLTSWFAARERGTYWGLWNVAHNTGGFLSPLVAATAAHAAGWRWGMWAPGLAGMALGLYVLLVCRDTPQDAGFNPVDTAQAQSKQQQQQQHQQQQQQQQPQPRTDSGPSSSGRSSGGVILSGSNGSGEGKVLTAAASNGNGATSSTSSSRTSTSSSSSSSSAAEAGDKKPGVLRTAIDNVLSNPYIWALALTYFCVYVVRQGVTSWTVFYLINEKGVPDAAQAAMRVSGLELGGLVGGLAAGRLSDVLIRRATNGGSAGGDGDASGADKGTHATAGGVLGTGSVGTRVQVVMAYTVALAAALAAFQALPASVPPSLQWLSVAAIGFCIYGPQMLIGLCGAELVHPASVGASQGVLGWVAYLGAANAGVPLSWIITRFGWTAYFSALLAACGVALLLLAPLMRLPSFTQRQQQQQQHLAAAADGDGSGARARAA